MTLQPLRVRAVLASGIAQAAPWGISLDGLLAAQMWERTKADHRAAGVDVVRAMDQADPPDLDLPLQRCVAGDGRWHWAATCARPDGDPALVDVRTRTSRVDHRGVEVLAASLPKVISARQGRYRARRAPLPVTPCRSVTWHAVGDQDTVRELLGPVLTIGKARTGGEGQVLSWQVETAPDLDEVVAAHLHPDGTLGRTTPPGCFARLSGTPLSGGVGTAGLRPPYMHRSRQHPDLYLPALLHQHVAENGGGDP